MTFPRLIEGLRKSALVTGSLVALLVLVGPLQYFSLGIRDAEAQVIVICSPSNPTPTNIVQDCDIRGSGLATLESQAVDSLLALHHLPASDAGRIRAWEREAVRALIFTNLMAMIEKEPGERTPTEQSIVDGMADFVKARRIAAAQYSLDQYNAWSNNPCGYQAPHGFTYERDNAWCDDDLVKTFRGPIPPTLEDFLNYGFAEIYQDFGDDGAAELISGETARLLGVVGGFIAAGLAAAIGANIGAALPLATGIIHAIHPFLATSVARLAAQVGSQAVADAAGAGAGALSIGAVATIIIVAVVIIVIQAITVIAQTEIPVQLQEGLNQAQAGVDLRQLAQSDGGKAEIYAAFILTTLPDFPNLGSVPAAQATDRTFVITDPQGNRAHSYTINYQCWNPRHCQGTDFEHTARVHDGWFVDQSDATGAERMTLGIDYVDWNGEGWTASRIGLQKFLHTRTGDDDAEPFVSEEIKYLDPSGAQMTAVLNHPPSPGARPVASDRVNNGVFELSWDPPSTDADGDPVTYTLFRCDANTVEYVNDILFCDQSTVASGLTTTSYAFTDDSKEIAGLYRYYVRPSDGRLESIEYGVLSLSVLVDQQPPVIAFVSRTPPNSYGWNNADVTVEWSCSDTSTIPDVPPSGVVAETLSKTVTTEGYNQSATGVCEDEAGNTASETVGEISIDKTAPNPLFDGPYVVNEGSSIQLRSVLSTDSLSGIASAAFALDGDDQFDDGDPATFDGIDGPSTHPVKLRVEDRAGNVAIAETTVTVDNVAPTIDEILTNGPVSQGLPVTLTVGAGDPGGINDPLSYAFDCDEDGVYETAGTDNQGVCTLDPAAAITTIGVQVSDDDGGITTDSVEVGQTLTLCASYYSGSLTVPSASGCAGGSFALTLPAAGPTTFCINLSTGAMTWSWTGSCPSTVWQHIVPDGGPLYFCQSLWTGKLSHSWTGECNASELPGVIPGRR